MKLNGMNKSSGLLEEKKVLVTGGSGGLGRGICDVAAREGAHVAFTWYNNEKGAQDTENILQTYGSDYLSIHIDLRAQDSAGKVVETIVEKWGTLDALVNNAAVSESIPFILIDNNDFYDLMELNLFAVFRLSQAAVRPMIRQKYGRIVNISSIAGSRTIPSPVHYACSKGAIEGLTHSLAHEVGPYGIMVNAVAAGIFEGGLRSTIPEHHQQRYLNACALSRFGTPMECGELVAWLLSDRNTYMNGAVLYHDGGTLG